MSVLRGGQGGTSLHMSLASEFVKAKDVLKDKHPNPSSEASSQNSGQFELYSPWPNCLVYPRQWPIAYQREKDCFYVLLPVS